jgi:hypothetical protein
MSPALRHQQSPTDSFVVHCNVVSVWDLSDVIQGAHLPGLRLDVQVEFVN